MSSGSPALDQPFQRLRDVRNSLLRLHKALLDSERHEYEQRHGQIRSPGEFLQLVLGDDWFSWLRPISQFIVQIDEAMSSREPATLTQAHALLSAARQLLQPSESGDSAAQRYYQAIQRDPDIAILHLQIADLLRED